MGRVYKQNIPTLNNCFYSANSLNKGVGTGTVTGEAKAVTIDSNLITTLNEYVVNYNTTNKANADFIELKSWKLDGDIIKFE